MVFTHGRRCSPFSTAFLASSAAPIITEGLEVLVHEVIAAMLTAPLCSSKEVPSARVTGTAASGLRVYAGSSPANADAASDRATRSWGRFGPASDGTTVDRSSSSFSE